MREEMYRCAREGTPRPESQRSESPTVRAHAPNALWAFADSWKAILIHWVSEHMIKELCRVYISRTVNCELCGNQRSVKARTAGLAQAQYDELADLESSTTCDDR